MAGEVLVSRPQRGPASGLGKYGHFASVCLLSTAVFLVLLPRGPRPAEGPEEAVGQVEDAGALHYLTYANAVVITLTAAASLGGLFRYLRSERPGISSFWLALVWAYCAMNVFVYGSQLALPSLSMRGEALRLAPFVHNHRGSLASRMNAGAYALVGIPSVVLGLPLLGRGAVENIGGVALVSSAAADAVGFAGALTGNEKAGFGLIVGAAFFLVAIAALAVMFFAANSAGTTVRD